MNSDPPPTPGKPLLVPPVPSIDTPATVRIWRNEPTERPRPALPPPALPGSNPEHAVLPTVPGYELVEELGRGGMGVVYKARQLHLNRFVALKMVLAGELEDHDTLARFRDEAEAVARLQHPHIVSVYEVGEVGGRPFFSMEYVGGGNLAQRIGGVPQLPVAAATLVETLARAVQFAHEHGIIHRDMKPANILLAAGKPPSTMVSTIDPVTDSTPPPPPITERLPPVRGPELGQPKITDFGLAKHIGVRDKEPVLPTPSQRGLIVGTPQYMAPEQANGTGEEVGPGVDVYSLGAILYEMLTGQPPFHGTNAMDTLLQVRFLDPIRPSYWQPKLPRDLETICLKCLQKEPRKRYATASELADDLQRFRSGQPILARPAGLAEQVWKAVARSPVRSAVVGLVGGLLLAGAIDSFQRSRYAENRAETERAGRLQAERDRDELRAKVSQSERQAYAADVQSALLLVQARQPRAALAALHRADRTGRRGWEFQYLNGLLHGEHSTFDAPATPVRHAAASADGRWLAVAGGPDGAPGAVAVWDSTALQAAPRMLHGHAGPVLRLLFLPDGRLASGGSDGSVRVWDPATGADRGGVRGLPGAVDALAAVGDRIAAGTPGGLFVFDSEATTAPPSPVLPGAVRALASGDGLLAVAGPGGVALWPTSGGPTRRLDVSALPYSLLFDPAGGRLLGGCVDGSVRGWSLGTGLEEFAVPVAASAVIDLTAVAGQVWLGLECGAAVRWANNRPDATLLPCGSRSLTALIAAGPGRLLSAGVDGDLALWDAGRDPRGRFWTGAAAAPRAAAFRDDGKTLAVLRAGAGPLELWSVSDGPRENCDWPAGSSVLLAAFDGTGRTVARVLSDDPRGVRVVDSRTGAVVRNLPPFAGPVTALALSDDGSRLACGVRVGGGVSVVVVAVEGEAAPQTLALDGVAAVTCLAFDSTGRLAVGRGAVSSGRPAAVSVLAEGSPTVTATLDGPFGGAKGLRFSPNGSVLAVMGATEASARLWDVAKREAVARLDGDGTLGDVAFSPDGTRIAAATVGGVRLWDAATGEELLRLPVLGPLAAPGIVLFNADGSRLAAVDAAGGVAVYEAMK